MGTKSQDEIEISKIKCIVKTIDQAHKYLSKSKKSVQRDLPIIDFQQTAFHNWRMTELSIRVNEGETPELARQLNKWKNITKIYHCPSYLVSTLVNLTSEERQDIIDTLTPICRQFICQLSFEQALKTQRKGFPHSIIGKPYEKKFLYEQKRQALSNC